MEEKQNEQPGAIGNGNEQILRKQMEAIQAAKAGNMGQAESKIHDAEQAIVEAHHSQTDMLTKEAQGEKTEITLLTVHSQDHLMTSIAFCDLAKEVIGLYDYLQRS